MYFYLRSLSLILLLAVCPAEIFAQTTVWLRHGGPFTRKRITNIRPGTPPVFTSPKHGFANGDRIAVQAVSGMPTLAGIHVVQNATEDTFEIAGVDAGRWRAAAYGRTKDGPARSGRRGLRPTRADCWMAPRASSPHA